MLKKFGVVTMGVAAGLVTAAPFATATESGHHDRKSSESDTCTISGGNAEAEGDVRGGSLIGGLVQAPVGANLANVACSDILSNNVSGNSIAVNLGGGEADADA